MFYKYTFFIIAASIFIIGCSNVNQQVLKPSKGTIKSGYLSKSGFFYVLLERDEEKNYKIITIQEEPIEKLSNSKQEILRVSNDYKIVELYFKNALPKSPNNKYDCTQAINTNVYNQCTTDFSGAYVGETAAKNIASAFSTTKNAGSHRYIDYDLLNQTIKDTKLFEAIEERKFISEHKEVFKTLKTLEDYDWFIDRYSFIKSSESLVPQVIQKRDDMIKAKEKDAEDVLERQKKASLEEQAKEAREELRIQREKDINQRMTNIAAKNEQNAIDEINKKLRSFRGNIKKGTHTNCGEVMELKGSQAKVNHSKSEHWINTDKLFPKEYGCVFVKGHYVAPPAF